MQLLLKVYKCCTPVNKAMSEISNCCITFVSNLCSRASSSEIESAANCQEVNVENAILQMMSTTAVEETLHRELLSSQPRPFHSEALY